MTAVKVAPAVDVVDGRWMKHADDDITEQWELDLAQALGYAYEDITTLIAHPFAFDGDHVIAVEVVFDEDGNAIVDLSDDNAEPGVLTREVKHPLPNGWQVIATRTVLSTETTYEFVSPFDRARLH